MAVAEEVVSMVPLAMRQQCPMSSQESRTTRKQPRPKTLATARATLAAEPRACSLSLLHGPSSLLPGWGSAGAEAVGSVEVAEPMAAMVVTVEVEMAEGCPFAKAVVAQDHAATFDAGAGVATDVELQKP